MSTLIVFYSRSGHTRQLARGLATWCGADLEEIRGARSREGFGDRQAFDEMSRRCGQSPLATLAVTEKQLPVALHAAQLAAFAARIDFEVQAAELVQPARNGQLDVIKRSIHPTTNTPLG